MQIEKSGAAELTIIGNIKSIEDSDAIKRHIGMLAASGANSISLKIADSFSMTSSVIGFLMKLVHRDKVRLSISIRDERLFTLLQELNLVSTFNASVMKS